MPVNVKVTFLTFGGSWVAERMGGARNVSRRCLVPDRSVPQSDPRAPVPSSQPATDNCVSSKDTINLRVSLSSPLFEIIRHHPVVSSWRARREHRHLFSTCYGSRCAGCFSCPDSLEDSVLTMSISSAVAPGVTTFFRPDMQSTVRDVAALVPAAASPPGVKRPTLHSPGSPSNGAYPTILLSVAIHAAPYFVPRPPQAAATAPPATPPAAQPIYDAVSICAPPEVERAFMIPSGCGVWWIPLTAPDVAAPTPRTVAPPASAQPAPVPRVPASRSARVRCVIPNRIAPPSAKRTPQCADASACGGTCKPSASSRCGRAAHQVVHEVVDLVE